MIANPEKAIERAPTPKKLAEVIYELLKESYPGSDIVGWQVWIAKYKNLQTAKKCAWSMYKRIMGL